MCWLPSIVALMVMQSGQAAPQDPWGAAPDHFKVELDNEHVRIVRVTHAPNSKASMHQHSSLPRVVVQLTGGEVRITDSSGKSTIIHTVPGRFAYVPGAKTLPHEDQNLGTNTVEALLIELKCEHGSRQPGPLP